MQKKFVKDIRREDIPLDGASNAQMQWIFSRYDGTATYSFRRFIMHPKGKIPEHSHPWEHIIYILEGEGFITEDGTEYRARSGHALYIKPNKLHGYENRNGNDFIFLCIIPNEGDKREFKYWTREQLKKEGKILCEECTFSEGKKCTMLYPMMAEPEEMFWSLEGNILACEFGERKKP